MIHPRFLLHDGFAATVEAIDPENASKAKRDVQTGELQVALTKGRSLKVKVTLADTGAPAEGARYPDIRNYVVSPARLQVGSGNSRSSRSPLRCTCSNRRHDSRAKLRDSGRRLES